MATACFGGLPASISALILDLKASGEVDVFRGMGGKVMEFALCDK